MGRYVVVVVGMEGWGYVVEEVELLFEFGEDCGSVFELKIEVVYGSMIYCKLVVSKDKWGGM